jgi:t-SNARE complex subunit (syntaxin)
MYAINLATNLERTLKTIGTRNDTDALRDSVHTVTTTALKSIAESTTILKKLTAMVQTRGVPENKEAKLKVTKLTSDFKLVVQKFTDTQKQIVSKMKTTTPVGGSGFLDSTTLEDQKQSLVDSEAAQQAQLQYQQHLEFEQGLLIERENRVRQIEADILDVNDIMKDLANLVVEQGAVVDSIEGNIDTAYDQVEGGRAELQKAATYQVINNQKQI